MHHLRKRLKLFDERKQTYIVDMIIFIVRLLVKKEKDYNFKIKRCNGWTLSTRS